MFSMSVLRSGSNGNCTLLWTASTVIAIDAGLSASMTRRYMKDFGLDPDCLHGIFLTHEHGDHCTHAGKISEETAAPVFVSAELAMQADGIKALEWMDRTPSLEMFDLKSEIVVGDITVQPFALSHDAIDPVGFRCTSEGITFCVSSDSGVVTDGMVKAFQQCHALAVESNHQTALLLDHPQYPKFLKDRVDGPLGHMSNEHLAKFLRSTAFDGSPRHLVLTHLSQDNNSPALAKSSARMALSERGLDRIAVSAASHLDYTPPIVF